MQTDFETFVKFQTHFSHERFFSNVRYYLYYTQLDDIDVNCYWWDNIRIF